MTDDRDELVPKHQRPTTAPVEAVEPESSGAIEDPDARQAWREANRSLSERVARTEGRLNAVAAATARTEGMVVVILANSEESAKEREARRAKDAIALVARERRQAADRRNKIIVTVVAGVLALLGVLAKALA